MPYYTEYFTTEPAENPFYPPELRIPLMIGVGVLPREVCEGLSAEILKREKKILKEFPAVSVAGKTDGITTRWLDYNILTWDIPEVKVLRTTIKEAYSHYMKFAKVPRWKNEIQCWANVLRKGDSLRIHHHNFRQRPVISATFSLTTAKTSTCYVFPIWMKVKDNEYSQEICFPTTQGNLLMVPGWVSHYTTPHPGPKPRITLGLDIASGLTTGTRLPFDKGRGKIFV